MGTRSLVNFYNDDKQIACIYQQFDGYPSGVGDTLGRFLQSGKMVNGIPAAEEGVVYFNGMGCLAAQFIAKHKDGPGGLYLYAPGTTDVWEEYIYEVYGGLSNDNGPQALRVVCKDTYGDGKALFDGNVDDFLAFCNMPESEE